MEVSRSCATQSNPDAVLSEAMEERRIAFTMFLKMAEIGVVDPSVGVVSVTVY